MEKMKNKELQQYIPTYEIYDFSPSRNLEELIGSLEDMTLNEIARLNLTWVDFEYISTEFELSESLIMKLGPSLEWEAMITEQKLTDQIKAKFSRQIRHAEENRKRWPGQYLFQQMKEVLM